MNLTKKLIALGLALGPLVPVVAGQPVRTSGDWGVRFGKPSKAAHLSVSIGSRGFGIDLASRRRPRTSQRSGLHQHGACCAYVPGHYQTRVDRVWVPGYTDKVWVPARYQVSYNACGQRIKTLVSPAHWQYVNRPGYYENRQVQVWVTGSYRCGGGGITAYPAGRRWR